VDNLIHNYQNTILIPTIVGSMVKIVKEEQKVCDIFAQVQMLLHLLFSFNYPILPQVTTSHPFFCQGNHQKQFLNLVVRCHHNLPT